MARQVDTGQITARRIRRVGDHVAELLAGLDVARLDRAGPLVSEVRIDLSRCSVSIRS